MKWLSSIRRCRKSGEKEFFRAHYEPNLSFANSGTFLENN
jgi:hypothetical protein